MGATCDCDCGTDSESDGKRTIRCNSKSIEGETGRIPPPVEISVTRSMSNENLSPVSVTKDYLSPVANTLHPAPWDNQSMSLISSAAAFLDAPEQRSENKISMTFDEGDFDDIATAALDFQQDTLRTTAKSLHPIKGWLEKKQNAPPYAWQKRYVVIQDGYLLWSDREMTIEEGISDKEKRRWNKCVNLNQIEGVTMVESKKERKFEIRKKDESRCWLWKASSKKNRDYWIDCLSENIEYTHQKSLLRR
eukprot:296237_1